MKEMLQMCVNKKGKCAIGESTGEVQVGEIKLK